MRIIMASCLAPVIGRCHLSEKKRLEEMTRPRDILNLIYLKGVNMYTKIECTLDNATVSLDAFELLNLVQAVVTKNTDTSILGQKQELKRLMDDEVLLQHNLNKICVNPPIELSDDELQQKFNELSKALSKIRGVLRSVKSQVTQQQFIPAYEHMAENIRDKLNNLDQMVIDQYSKHYQVASNDLRNVIVALNALWTFYNDIDHLNYIRGVLDRVEKKTKPSKQLLSSLPIADFILPLAIKGMKTPKDWLAVSHYINKGHAISPVTSWWLNLGGRLICIRNKTAGDHFLFGSDHGSLKAIESCAQQSMASFVFDHDSITYDYWMGLSDTLSKKFNFKIAFTKDYIKNAYSVSGKSKYPLYNQLNKILHPEDASRYILADMLSGLHLEISKGSIDSLIRPLGAYGEAEKGDSYTGFAQAILDYHAKKNTLSDAQIAKLARDILKGCELTNDDLAFLPNLLTVLNLSETTRIDRIIMSNLMLLDLLEADYKPDGKTPSFSWLGLLAHPKRIKEGKVLRHGDFTENDVVKNLYGKEVELIKFDGLHPSAHFGSGTNTKIEFGRLTSTQQKEGNIILQWLAMVLEQQGFKVRLVGDPLETTKKEAHLDYIMRPYDKNVIIPSAKKRPDAHKKYRWVMDHVLVLLQDRLGSFDSCHQFLNKPKETLSSVFFSSSDRVSSNDGSPEFRL